VSGTPDLLGGRHRTPVEVERVAGGTVVRVHGDLDVELSSQLRDCIAGLVDDGARELVVELGEVPFCDSSGLGVLVGAHRRMTAVGGHVAVAHPSPAVRHLLELSGLDRIFDVS
jgi:anti-sigma B factor antagonist